MPPWAKKVLAWGLVAFCLYAVLFHPTLAAEKVGAVWDFTSTAARNVIAFFNGLLNR